MIFWNFVRLTVLFLLTSFSNGQLGSPSLLDLSKPGNLLRAERLKSRRLEEAVNFDNDINYTDNTEAPVATMDDGNGDDTLGDQDFVDDISSTDDGSIQGEQDVLGEDDETMGESVGDADADGTSVITFGLTDIYSTPPEYWSAFDWFVVAAVLAAWGFICIWMWSIIQQCRRWCCPKKAPFDDSKLDMSELSSYYSRHSKD